MKTTSRLLLALVLAFSPALRAAVDPLPFKIPAAVPDVQAFQVPDRVRLGGWVGARVAANEANRLVRIDTDRLLEGYHKRPGRQSWDGEHIGKWLHAATLAWVNTGDPALRAKLDAAVIELAKCQQADGYLGTYLEKDRWTEWDVWAHKYNLLGLLTYMQYTGNREPMLVCIRMADLLCATFGDAPGKRDIILAGQHVGMAPTSVLEPMVLLYRTSGEPRYLEFCQYILRAWEHDNGPHIVSRLLDGKPVSKVGNAKAYEMLSCFNGALEYYRLTGERKILDACLNAWQDITAHRLYPTGAASYGERFHDDYDMPNANNVGETCVTVTWLQFNAQLLRLTGEARFAEQLERVVLNQLFGSQSPDGAAWAYFAQMEGTKPYSSTLDGHCCLSSGPRGVALIPTFALTTDADGPVVNLYDAGKARLALRDGTAVTLTTETLYPSSERIRITVEPAVSKTFTIKLRLPEWCRSAALTVAGKKVKATVGPDGYAAIQREWAPGEVIELVLPMQARVIVGDHLNQDKVAVCYGPLVLAADAALLGDSGQTLQTLCLAGADPAALRVTPESATGAAMTWPGARLFRVNAIANRTTPQVKAGGPLQIRLVPFADAGATGTRYQVWLPLRAYIGASLLSGGRESRSRPGNLKNSTCDEDMQSPVVTYDGKPAAEDWFAVSLAKPARIGRIVFVHGANFPDGGWFDASAGKPKVQVQRTADAAWETVGELADYPATSAAEGWKIQNGQKFALTLAQPVAAIAVRVIGKPACGKAPQQAFASCAELQAFAK